MNWWMGESLRRRKERDVEAIDVLLRELNVISFLAFTQVYIFLPLSIALALSGRTIFMLGYSVPWTIAAVVYLYWRMKYFRARCKRYSKAKQAQEYWSALEWDSLRIVVIGGFSFSTFGPFLVKAATVLFFAATFITGMLVFSILVGFGYITYWSVARMSS